jgi:septum site-determining protein MinC
MSQSVSIKGTKSGIILVLDDQIPSTQLKTAIAEKFAESAAFLGQARMGLMIRGARLTDEQESEVLDIIAENTKLNIVCILDEEHPLDSAFTRAVADIPVVPREMVQPQAVRPAELTPEEKSRLMDQAYDAAYNAAFEQIGDANARIHVGNLRSGQEIVSQHSIVIFGDVNPGGSVVSAGSIFVFGALHGTAFAGACGDSNAFVMAMDFDPLQIRISDSIAVSEDDKSQKNSGRFLRRGKKKKSIATGPEVAYTYEGAIAKSAYDRTFLQNNKFFS